MKFVKLNGKTAHKNITKYLVDWDAKCLSKFQFNVKQFLKQYWVRHICYEEMPLVGTQLRVDFVNMTKGIAVETHGDQHREHVPFFHGKSKEKFLSQITRDTKKIEWCEKNDIRLVEIYTDDFPNLSPKWFKEKYGIALI